MMGVHKINYKLYSTIEYFVSLTCFFRRHTFLLFHYNTDVHTRLFRGIDIRTLETSLRI